jgi:hypothetical protein
VGGDSSRSTLPTADTVTCLSNICHTDNHPHGNPDYEHVNNEGQGWVGPGSAYINGTLYNLVPLTVWFSEELNDNYVADQQHAPSDPSYYSASIGDGYILETQAPGTIPLQMYFNGKDHATLASNVSISAYLARGYHYLFTVGYILP